MTPGSEIDANSGRGRRERRCAGEEKEEGVSCLSSKSAGEHSVQDSARRSEGGGGSECAMRREHHRPPILKLGVLGHAFVAAAGVLQNGKLKQCNFEVENSEGSRQFLIVLVIGNRSRVEEWNTPLEISLVGKFFA